MTDVALTQTEKPASSASSQLPALSETGVRGEFVFVTQISGDLIVGHALEGGREVSLKFDPEDPALFAGARRWETAFAPASADIAQRPPARPYRDIIAHIAHDNDTVKRITATFSDLDNGIGLVRLHNIKAYHIKCRTRPAKQRSCSLSNYCYIQGRGINGADYVVAAPVHNALIPSWNSVLSNSGKFRDIDAAENPEFFAKLQRHFNAIFFPEITDPGSDFDRATFFSIQAYHSNEFGLIVPISAENNTIVPSPGSGRNPERVRAQLIALPVLFREVGGVRELYFNAYRNTPARNGVRSLPAVCQDETLSISPK